MSSSSTDNHKNNESTKKKDISNEYEYIEAPPVLTLFTQKEEEEGLSVEKSNNKNNGNFSHLRGSFNEHFNQITKTHNYNINENQNETSNIPIFNTDKLSEIYSSTSHYNKKFEYRSFNRNKNIKIYKSPKLLQLTPLTSEEVEVEREFREALIEKQRVLNNINKDNSGDSTGGRGTMRPGQTTSRLLNGKLKDKLDDGVNSVSRASNILHISADKSTDKWEIIARTEPDKTNLTYPSIALNKAPPPADTHADISTRRSAAVAAAIANNNQNLNKKRSLTVVEKQVFNNVKCDNTITYSSVTYSKTAKNVNNNENTEEITEEKIDLPKKKKRVTFQNL
ncbi:hypothetical protein CDIK_1715 [Cucumispora dikerogammari]|nr:hypothetical protein CDIK_1715 [Cucumispora dikerogammari]